MKKLLKVSLVLCLVLSLVIAGCSKKEAEKPAASNDAKTKATPAPEIKDITLKITHWIPESKEIVEKIGAAFTKANPGVKIEFSILPGDQYGNVLKTKLLAGDGPDVFFNFHGSANDYAANDLLGDFTGSPIYDRLAPAFKKLNAKGQFVSVPLDYGAHGVYYNKTIFQQLGVQPPNNYAGFIALCETIKKAGITPLALGAKDQWQITNQFLPIFVSLSKAKRPNLNADLFDGTAKYSDPEFALSYKVEEELVQKGFFDKGVMGITWPQAAADFAAGKAAMFITGSFVVAAAIENNPKMQIGYFPFPADTGDPAILVAVNSDLEYNAKGKNTKLSKKFIEFFTEPANVKMYNEISVLKNASTFTDVELQLPPATLEVMENAKKYKSFNTEIFFPGQIGVLINDMMNGIMAGQKFDAKKLEQANKLLPDEKKANDKLIRPTEEAK